ncbi:uncharacterized protein LOC125481386, partial [Rhincodon typus]|uniref:uncharacterized protein LOC125481386 n=1 Tax=Rhincodon typus TaxID=259920 RepID=UPI002030B991
MTNKETIPAIKCRQRFMGQHRILIQKRSTVDSHSPNLRRSGRLLQRIHMPGSNRKENHTGVTQAEVPASVNPSFGNTGFASDPSLSLDDELIQAAMDLERNWNAGFPEDDVLKSICLNDIKATSNSGGDAIEEVNTYNPSGEEKGSSSAARERRSNSVEQKTLHRMVSPKNTENSSVVADINLDLFNKSLLSGRKTLANGRKRERPLFRNNLDSDTSVHPAAKKVVVSQKCLPVINGGRQPPCMQKHQKARPVVKWQIRTSSQQDRTLETSSCSIVLTPNCQNRVEKKKLLQSNCSVPVLTPPPGFSQSLLDGSKLSVTLTAT